MKYYIINSESKKVETMDSIIGFEGVCVSDHYNGWLVMEAGDNGHGWCSKVKGSHASYEQAMAELKKYQKKL